MATVLYYAVAQFTKLWLTSRCGISLVFLTDELKHPSLLETTEQTGSIQDGIYELHWSEVKPYASSQKSYWTIHWGSLGCKVTLWPTGHSSSGRRPSWKLWCSRNPWKVLLIESYNFPVKQAACPVSFVSDLPAVGPLLVILMRKDGALLVPLESSFSAF